MDKKEIQELENRLLNEKNLDLPIEIIINQIEVFKKGIPYLKLVKPCIIGDGIKVIPGDEQEGYIKLFLSALDERRTMKFVPASGAASRMFKDLFTFQKTFNCIY